MNEQENIYQAYGHTSKSGSTFLDIIDNKYK